MPDDLRRNEDVTVLSDRNHLYSVGLPAQQSVDSTMLLLQERLLLRRRSICGSLARYAKSHQHTLPVVARNAVAHLS